jgi:hypothetical protein
MDCRRPYYVSGRLDGVRSHNIRSQLWLHNHTVYHGRGHMHEGIHKLHWLHQYNFGAHACTLLCCLEYVFIQQTLGSSIVHGSCSFQVRYPIPDLSLYVLRVLQHRGGYRCAVVSRQQLNHVRSDIQQVGHYDLRTDRTESSHHCLSSLHEESSLQRTYRKHRPRSSRPTSNARLNTPMLDPRPLEIQPQIDIITRIQEKRLERKNLSSMPPPRNPRPHPRIPKPGLTHIYPSPPFPCYHTTAATTNPIRYPTRQCLQPSGFGPALPARHIFLGSGSAGDTADAARRRVPTGTGLGYRCRG